MSESHTLKRKNNKKHNKLDFAGHGSAPATMVDNWIPPLQRHTKADGSAEFTTIRIRLFGSDVQSDFNAKFPSGPLYAKDVCRVVAAKQGLSEKASKIFSLWVVGKDIELQLRPNEDIFKLMVRWHKWVEKYTHYPEAKNPTHPINRHWFVYRRAALVSREEEKMAADIDEIAVRLLYGEAQHSLQSGKYPCTTEDVVNLAALELQSHGDYDPLRHQPGYLSQGERWTYLVPLLMQKSMKPQAWEQKICEAHKAQKGKNPLVSRIRYLQYVRKWPFYGSSTFPSCVDTPPGNYFEMRIQHHLVGVTCEGITIIDQDKHKLIFSEEWTQLLWEFSLDSIKLVYFKNGKQKKMNIITPQAAIIENVIERAIHLETKANRPNHAAEDEVSTTPAYPLGGIMKHSSSGLLRQSSMVRSSQVSRTNSQNRTSQVDRFAHRISEVAQGSGARRLSVARGIREQRAMTYVASNDFQRVGAVGIINKEEVLQDDNY